MSDRGGGLWPRTAWMEAVWSSKLRPLERLVAAVYADHARDRDTAWLTLDRLMTCTGMSRDAANRARRGLVDAGWLKQVSAPNRRKAANYRLVIPPSEQSAARTTPLPEQSAARTAEQSATQRPSSPPDVPEQSASRTQPQTTPQTIHSNARVEPSPAPDRGDSVHGCLSADESIATIRRNFSRRTA